MGISFSKIVFFSIIFLNIMCYGQAPVTSDNIFVLITDRNEHPLSREIEGYFTTPEVQKYLSNQQCQYVQYYGQDLGKEWYNKWNITQYPTIIHLQKVGDGYGIRNRGIPRTITDVLKILGTRSTQPNKNNPPAQPWGTPPST